MYFVSCYLGSPLTEWRSPEITCVVEMSFTDCTLQIKESLA